MPGPSFEDREDQQLPCRGHLEARGREGSPAQQHCRGSQPPSLCAAWWPVAFLQAAEWWQEPRISKLTLLCDPPLLKIFMFACAVTYVIER